MKTEQAIKYFEDEIRYCENAPELNGCEMTSDWMLTLEASKLAVGALMEQQKRETVITNADRVRAMTDEELAKFISDGTSDLCSFCGKESCELRDDWKMCDSNDTDEGIFLKWLRRRAGR